MADPRARIGARLVLTRPRARAHSVARTALVVAVSQGSVAELRSVGAFLVNTLLPSMCRHCGRVVGGGEWEPLLCAACGNEFPFHDAAIPELLPVSQAHALATFEGPARRLLIDLKYDGLLRAGRAIGSRMADAPGARALLDDAQILVPVPLHWSRRWWRGHNQAAVLARGVRRRRDDAGDQDGT